MEKSNILITGGAGFVGSNLGYYILNNYNINKLYIVDNLLSSDTSNIPNNEKVEFIYGSIAEDRVLQKIKDEFDYIFHLSCYHGNQSSILNPLLDHENNTLTSLKLFDCIKDFNNLKKVVYSAAGCAVAEKTNDEPLATLEDAPISLFHDSPYSISKIIGEMYGNYYFSRNKLPFVKARFQNVYGPREILGAGSWRGTVHTVWRNVIPAFIWKSLNHEALPLDNGGLGSRDFIFVDDIVRGLLACALKGKPGESYNLASGVDTTILELANLINFNTNSKTPHSIKPPREWDNSGRRYGSVLKSKKELGFETQVHIEDGISKTVEWTQNNKKLIETNIEKHKFFIKKS